MDVALRVEAGQSLRYNLRCHTSFG